MVSAPKSMISAEKKGKLAENLMKLAPKNLDHHKIYFFTLFLYEFSKAMKYRYTTSSILLSTQKNLKRNNKILYFQAMSKH